MSKFITVAKTQDVPPGTGRTVEVQGVWIALFNVDGSFFAVDNTCPHAGGPIGEGSLSGDVVTCPWHGWSYEIKTGTLVQDRRVGVSRHDVRIEDDQVSVRLTD